ncbi:thiamine phosphate synthase [Devosia sp. A16]|uniref:thiamine phosphate synthase n=1 Tax=Devosia sp. A16 TaxID=1736675 RepID=UPI0006D7D982|nr:thiamine phosphate synthase [Devosia sp. A16]
MSAEIFLIAPTDTPADQLVSALTATLERDDVAALLLPRGKLSENAYKDLAKRVVPVAQARGAAVLVEGEPGLVRLLGADGLHVPGGIKAVEEAVAALKPKMIVGAGDIHSRDDAMLKGEAGVDYILFGPLSGSISASEREMAQWWAETMEIPSVLSDPEAGPASYDAGDCEFIGLPLTVSEPTK